MLYLVLRYVKFNSIVCSCNILQVPLDILKLLSTSFAFYRHADVEVHEDAKAGNNKAKYLSGIDLILRYQAWHLYVELGVLSTLFLCG